MAEELLVEVVSTDSCERWFSGWVSTGELDGGGGGGGVAIPGGRESEFECGDS